MTFLIHGLAEILQVVGKALLLLADVELLDVIKWLVAPGGSCRNPHLESAAVR